MSSRLSILLVFAALIASCTGSYPLATDSSISLAPKFQAFYSVHGAERTLGPPISASFKVNGVIHQCFVGGCLEYHPQLEPERRVTLSALPAEIRHQPSSSEVPRGSDDEGLYFPQTGHAVPGAFRQFFEAYGGLHFFGYPASPVYVRNDHQLVQYFERAILVWDMNLPPAEAVQLAPVGSFSFERRSDDHLGGFLQEMDSRVTETTETAQSIADFAQAHGGRQVFGSPVGGAHLTEDGVVEQVYANAVVIEDTDVEDGFSLRPLGRLAYGGVGLPVPSDASPESTYYAETGHNVIAAFKIYYNAYGGEQLFGLPISEAFVRDGALVQYFENVQMVWQAGSANVLGISLHELGLLYASSWKSTPDVSIAPAGLLHSTAVNVHSWVRFPFVLPGDMQEINVMVTDGRGQTIPDALVTVKIKVAQGVATFVLAPTGADGRSSLIFPVVAGQGNYGTLVTYSALVQAADTSTVITDSFHVLTMDGS